MLAKDVQELRQLLLQVIDKRRSEVKELKLMGMAPPDILGMMIMSQEESDENPLSDEELLVSVH
jgi:cytochrome P450